MNDTKINIFIKEIGYIKKERYRDNIKKLISYLPDYFFEIPASSTGKYHPKYAIRISEKNFGFENNVKSVPLYAVFCITK